MPDLNPSTNQVPKPPPGYNQTDHYSTPGKKFIDFCLGFIGTIIFYFVGWTITIALGQLAYRIASFLSSFYYGLALFVLVWAIIFFRRRGRRFIGLGILWAIIAPVVIVGLLLGACFLALSKNGGF